MRPRRDDRVEGRRLEPARRDRAVVGLADPQREIGLHQLAVADLPGSRRLAGLDQRGVAPTRVQSELGVGAHVQSARAAELHRGGRRRARNREHRLGGFAVLRVAGAEPERRRAGGTGLADGLLRARHAGRGGSDRGRVLARQGQALAEGLGGRGPGDRGGESEDENQVARCHGLASGRYRSTTASARALGSRGRGSMRTTAAARL